MITASTTITHQWLQLTHTISIEEFEGVFLRVTKTVLHHGLTSFSSHK